MKSIFITLLMGSALYMFMKSALWLYAWWRGFKEPKDYVEETEFDN